MKNNIFIYVLQFFSEWVGPNILIIHLIWIWEGVKDRENVESDPLEGKFIIT